MPLALTHVDPRRPDAAGAVERLAASTGGFLVGGLTAAAGETSHESGGATGTLSGVALSPAAVEIATALSQGCTPLGRAHEVTRGKDNLLIELDGRRALDVFIEDIGEELASDLRRVGGLIFAALPVAGSDTADYTVRNLVGIDPGSGIIAIGEAVPEGGKVLFCRRDRETAVGDMRRMAEDLKRRVGERVIRGGVYVSCAARGPNQFASPQSETEIIQGAPRPLPDGRVLRQRRAQPGSHLRLYRRADPLSSDPARRFGRPAGTTRPCSPVSCHSSNVGQGRPAGRPCGGPDARTVRTVRLRLRPTRPADTETDVSDIGRVTRH